MKFYRKKSIVLDTKINPLNHTIKSSISKLVSKIELNLDIKINNLASDITQKIIEGKKPEQISVTNDPDIYDILSYILDKNVIYNNYMIILNQYLLSLRFLEIFSLPESFIDKKDLFNKVSLSFKKEKIKSEKIIYLNGQIGKKCYIILDGRVSILEPCNFYVKGTYEKFYQYMEFLLLNNEYELIRLCFSSNTKYINEKKTLYKNKFYKFNDLLERHINSDLKMEPTDEKAYIEKFDFFINKCFDSKNILDEKQKKIQEELEKKIDEEEKKEKEKEEEEQKLEEDPDRIITGNDAANDRYEILDKIRKIKRQSIIDFYKKKKKKKIKDKDKVFILWKYTNKNITILKKGDSFAEIALKKNDNKIKSTIISKTDCLFCYLERDEYRNLISEFIDDARRINVDSLMHSKLFHNYNPDLFNIHYFSFFTPVKKAKGDYLFRQKDVRKNIFFIKNGGVQIEYFSCWSDLDDLLDILSEQTTKKKKYNNMVLTEEELKNFIYKKQKFNIFNYFNGEIAGTNEILYPDTDVFMFDAVCTSECEIFSLDVESLKNIINEKIIRKNYNELNVIKKEKLIQRLMTIKSNMLFQYSLLIHSENKKQSTEKTLKNNDSIFNDKSRNKLSIKTNLFSSSSDLKKEIINNYCSERTKKSKGIQLLKLKNIDPLSFRNTEQEESKIFNEKNKKYKLLEINNYNNTEYSKTERNEMKKSHSRKVTINFSYKGKVPKLLINKVNTVNKVLDQFILKEKDWFNVNNSARSKNNSKNFINHLDILSFDNYMNKIESNFKNNKEENSKGKESKIKKLIISPVSLRKIKKYKYIERKTNFRKDSIS